MAKQSGIKITRFGSGQAMTRLQADLTLLFVAVIWGSAFVAQRVAAASTGAFGFNGLRFLMGALVLLPFAWRERQRIDRNLLAGVVLVGLLLFGGAAFQQLGIQTTTAGNAGFVTGLYVVFIPLLLTFVWRRPPHPAIWPAAFLAAAGLFLLSTAGRLALNTGDLLVLAGSVLWAFHVIFIGKLVQRAPVLQLAFGQYLVCGLLSLLVSLIWEPPLLPGLVQAGWAVAYTGLLSTALGYTLQAVGQKVAPPADAAILLSLEAVVAALFGWWLLDELLSPVQLLGCGLMFAGMLLAQAPALMNRKGDQDG